MGKEIKGYELTRDFDDTIMVRLRRSHVCDVHYHKQIELLYVNIGKINVEIDKQNFVMKKGEFLIINSYCLHRYKCLAPTCSAVCIPIKYTSLFNGLYNINTAFTLIQKSKHTKKIYKSMKTLLKFRRVNSYVKDSLIYGLLGSIYDTGNVTTTHKTSTATEISSKIIEYINSNYSENINLDSLSGHCGYSKNHMSTIFNSNFHCNFNEYLNLRRLQAFIEIMSTEQNLCITDTAERVGFNSPRTFFNAFKNHYNMTPKDYLALKK